MIFFGNFFNAEKKTQNHVIKSVMLRIIMLPQLFIIDQSGEIVCWPQVQAGMKGQGTVPAS